MPNSHSTKWARLPLAFIPWNCDLEQWNVASWTQKLSAEEVERFRRVLKWRGDTQCHPREVGRWGERSQAGASTPACLWHLPLLEQLAFPQKRTHHLCKEGQAPDNCKLLKDQTELSDLHPSCLVICYPTDNNSHFTHDTCVFGNNLEFYNYFHKASTPFPSFPFANNFPVASSLGRLSVLSGFIADSGACQGHCHNTPFLFHILQKMNWLANCWGCTDGAWVMDYFLSLRNLLVTQANGMQRCRSKNKFKQSFEPILLFHKGGRSESVEGPSGARGRRPLCTSPSSCDWLQAPPHAKDCVIKLFCFLLGKQIPVAFLEIKNTCFFSDGPLWEAGKKHCMI